MNRREFLVSGGVTTVASVGALHAQPLAAASAAVAPSVPAAVGGDFVALVEVLETSPFSSVSSGARTRALAALEPVYGDPSAIAARTVRTGLEALGEPGSFAGLSKEARLVLLRRRLYAAPTDAADSLQAVALMGLIRCANNWLGEPHGQPRQIWI